MQSFAILCNPLQSNVFVFVSRNRVGILCNPLQSYAILCNPLQSFAILRNPMQFYAILCNPMQCYAILCNPNVFLFRVTVWKYICQRWVINVPSPFRIA